MRLKNQIYFLLLSCILIQNFRTAQAKFSFKFNFVNCVLFDNEIAIIKNCGIKLFSRTNSVIQMRFTWKKTIQNNVTFDIQFLQKFSGWRPFLYHFNFDGCDFLKNPNKYFVLKIALDEIKNSTNLVKGCPFKKGEDIYLNYELPNEEHLADLLKLFPIDTGDYGVILKMFLNKKHSFSFNASLTYSDYSKIH